VNLILRTIRPVVLEQGSIELLGFDGAVLRVRLRSSETCNPFLLAVILVKNGLRQKLGKIRKGSVCLQSLRTTEPHQILLIGLQLVKLFLSNDTVALNNR